MINLRNIFNPSYSYIGLIAIAILILLIFLLQQDSKATLKTIGTTSLVAGITTLALSLLMKLVIATLIPYQYKIFIQVISNSLLISILYLSLSHIALGTILLIFSKIKVKKVR